MRSLSKIRGSLLGGAAGDALGYSVEFLSYDQIIERYGADGGRTRRAMRGVDKPYEGYLALAYLDWFKTQHRIRADARHRPCCWIYHVPEIHHRRAPGSTCMSVLENRNFGTLEHPCNDSKGCGGIMRAAPIGLFFDPKDVPQNQIDRLGAASAAITHGHVMGWLSAAAFVHMISRITYGGVHAADLKDLIFETNAAMSDQFGADRAEPIGVNFEEIAATFFVVFITL